MPSGWTPTSTPASGGYDRVDFIETKQVLMARSTVLEERGRDALMEDMLQDYRDAEAEAAEGR